MEKIITGKCVDYSSEGEGIIKTEKDIYFVSGLFIGEEAEVAYLYTRAGVKYAKLKKLITKSFHRIDGLCPISTACGGCQFQKLDYKSELEFKTNKVKKALSTIAGINVPVNDTIGMDDPYHYRNKIQIPLGKDKKGNIISGFYRAKSHEIIPIEECAIEDIRAIEILKSVKSLMKSMRIEPYDEDKRTGVIRHILIRTSKHYDEVMVTLITNVDSFPSRNNFVRALVNECRLITTVTQNINTRATNVILGDKERILYGKGYIKDSLLGVVFSISPKSFYQINPIQTEKLYRYAIDYAHITKDDIVFDAYSGIGTIGLIAASAAKEVLSVEIVKEACLDAVNNAKVNNINNFEVINKDASEYALSLKENNEKIDVLFMDPPRKGSDDKFLTSVMSLKPNRIVYISCNPATLARDLKTLTKAYQITSVQPFDLFPRTMHVETIVALKLKSKLVR